MMKTITVSPYLQPRSDDACVAFCFFRPVEYERPIHNLRIFLNDMQSAGIPVFSIELLYGNQAPVLSNPTRIVRSESVLFSKENLWNILEGIIPAQYSKIVFLDCDVRFTDPDWFNKSASLLDVHSLIQPMEYCYRDVHGNSSAYKINEAQLRPAIARGIANRRPLDIGVDYPGFGLGITRRFFKQIGGFCDYGLPGYGDSLFWGAFIRCGFSYYADFFAKTNFAQYQQYKENCLRAVSPETISYVAGNTALHLYHGSHANRRYADRDRYIPEHYELFYNADGVLEIKSDRDLRQYWVDRREDD
jgi:hypothetical protein